MITTLTGSNASALQAELNRLLAEFVDEYTDMGLEKLDGEEAEYDRIRESLESLPFLASKKLVVLRDGSANKMFVEKAESLLTEVPETTDVIIHEPKLDKRSSYYKFLKKHTDFKEFNELDEHGLVKWLQDQADISGSDARYLIDRVGANQQLLGNELAKLQAYDPKITSKTIDLLTEPALRSTIFQLLDVALAGNKQQTLKLYKEQRAQKVEPQQIIAMLAWQLHIIATVKMAGDRADDVVAKDAKINPFVVRKSRAIASKLTRAEIKKLVQDLAELDMKLKTISLDADDAVQAYLLNV